MSAAQQPLAAAAVAVESEAQRWVARPVNQAQIAQASPRDDSFDSFHRSCIAILATSKHQESQFCR